MPAQPAHVYFNALPRAARERLVAALQARGPGAPLAFAPLDPPMPGSQRNLGILGAILFASLFLLKATAGYGNPVHEDMRWGPEWIAALAVPFAVIAWVALRLAKRRVAGLRVPVAAGTWLLPLDVIEFTGPRLRVVPIATMARLEVDPRPPKDLPSSREVKLYFPDAAYAFVLPQTDAHALAARLGAAQQAARDASARGDAAALLALDPLFEARSGPAWAAAQQSDVAAPADGGPAASTREAPRWLRAPALAAAAATLVAAPSAWALRNRLSDDEAFSRLAHGGVMHCERYLVYGGRRAEEVRATLLPEAQWREVGRGNLAALRAFLLAHPRNPHVAEARAAVHEHFEAAQAAWQARAPAEDAALSAFMDRLFAWEEAHQDPQVRVRFSPPTTAALTLIDSMLAAGPGVVEGRRVAPIAPHLTDEALRPRESRVSDALARTFRPVVPAGVMQVVDGGRVPPDPEARALTPVFDVAYTVRPSGDAFSVDGLPTRAFIAMTFTFRVTMRVPGDGEDYTFTAAVMPDSHISFERRSDQPLDDAFVYGLLVDNAFNRLSERFHAVLFRDGPRASVAGGDGDGDEPAPPPRRRERRRR